MMRELGYQLVDVFTAVPFGGNQLAVFTEPGDLDGATMQLIARELNLSETVFVLPPKDATADFRLRIFTPAAELPFAGHPTVGTGFVLHHLGMIPPGDTLRLEEGLGVIEVRLTHPAGDKLLVTIQQPIPQFGTIVEDRVGLSAALSLTPDDLIASLPAQVVSSGMPFLFIPLRTLDIIRRVRIRLDLYEKMIAASGARGLFVFTPEVEQSGSSVHSRLFAPHMGISEDPATGSASGPLGAYLLCYGLVDAKTADAMIGEQGFEMQRPSLIYIHVEGSAEQVTGVNVGGYTQPIGSGVLNIPE